MLKIDVESLRAELKRLDGALEEKVDHEMSLSIGGQKNG